MRIISGTARGRRLKSPRDRRIRPTEDRIKENVFNLLQGPFQGAVVLDLFSGTGGMALEFASRGAELVWMVDQHPASIRLMTENVELTGLTAQCHIEKGDYRKVLEKARDQKMSFDYIYVDPPYEDQGAYATVLEAIHQWDLMAPGGRIVLEAPRDYDFSKSAPFPVLRQKNYGTKGIWIFEGSA
ncbi:MAG: 16S rRNA (guanine(966)-N(2))-methyltransferase RsmD [Tissierellia bacterium]|nr:16S rRNA (guanine(966)-N(2))-methyltransferase RsmD [Tissierellia bacterium]